MTIPTPTRKIPRFLCIGCLVAGACFLFDPFVGVFDFLPDAIGYLLIAFGLYRLADMDDRLGEAMRTAMQLSLVGVARLVALFLTLGFVSPTERPVFMLLILFSLGVVDLLLILPLWRHFEGGLIYLGGRADATALFDRTGRGGRVYARSACERYVRFTTIFFILREVLVVLPEMTVLTHEDSGAEWSARTLYDFVGTFRVVGIVISLVLGILWLALTIRFVGSLKKDTPFIDALRRKYETEVAPRHDLFAMRAVKASLVSLGVAAVLSLDLYVEGVSILPDFLTAIAMVVSILFLRRFAAKGKLGAALSVTLLYGAAATASWIMQLTYVSQKDLYDALKADMVDARLPMVTLVQAVTAVLFFAAFVCILRLLYDLARHHTGVRALHDGSTYAAERTESIHTRIRRKLIWVGVFAALSAISAVILWGGVPLLDPLDLPPIPTTSDVVIGLFYDFLREAYWMVDLLFGGALIALTIHADSEIFEQMDYTYLMN